MESPREARSQRQKKEHDTLLKGKLKTVANHCVQSLEMCGAYSYFVLEILSSVKREHQ